MSWLVPKKKNSSNRVLLISPHPSGMTTSNDAVFPFPFLGLTQLAAAIPPHYNVQIVDERVLSISGKEEADIVFITTLNFSSHRAYAIAELF